MKQVGRTKGGGTLTLLLALMCMALPLKAHARHGEDGKDRVGAFSTIVVSEDRPAADVVCAFCTVRVDGDVHGDIAVIFSTVTVSDGRTISGDVATLFSTLDVGDGARINGDLATVFGTANLAESVHVGGDTAVLASGLAISLLLAPLLILTGVIWLLVWVVRRRPV